MALLPNMWAGRKQRRVGDTVLRSLAVAARLGVFFLAATGAEAQQTSASAGVAAPGGGRQIGARLDFPWPMKTREHVDLWLHGFAMLQDDTTHPPQFRRGYQNEWDPLESTCRHASLSIL